MMEQKRQFKKLSMSNTKKEMLEAYHELLEKLKEKSETELKPEKKLKDKKVKEVTEVVDSLSSEGVVKEIGNLKMEIGKLLNQISDRLEEEVNKFKDIQKAIEFKEKELKELYEIEKAAETLAALIEAQHKKRQEFESEMALRKEELIREIETTRAKWEKEKKAHEEEVKERDAEEAKQREREREEFAYAFKREQQLLKDRLEDEKARVEREIQLKKEQVEKEFAEREKAIAEREAELNKLREKVETFPEEMEKAVNKAVKETSERIQRDAKNKEELLRKEFEGERRVLTTRIESLEKTVKEQNEQIARLSQQLEKAYQKVQDIAVKAIEGSSNLKSLAHIQQMINEQTRKQSQEH